MTFKLDQNLDFLKQDEKHSIKKTSGSVTPIVAIYHSMYFQKEKMFILKVFTRQFENHFGST